jgi:hypothetical protein
MNRADLSALLAIASGHAPPCPFTDYHEDGLCRSRLPTPDEWAAHLVAHALALGRAVDAEVARTSASVGEAAQHDHDCAPDSCAAGCPVATRGRVERPTPTAARPDETSVKREAERRQLQERIDELRKRFASYDGGDRPMSPPVRLIRELCDAEERMREMRAEDARVT